MSHVTKIRKLPITKAVLDIVKETTNINFWPVEGEWITMPYGNTVKKPRCIIEIPVPQNKHVKFVIDNKGDAHYDTYDSGGQIGEDAVDRFVQQCARAKVILDAQAVGYSEPTNEIVHENGVIELEVEV